MTSEDWATVADLATALGTLILAVATFASVRSASVMAKIAQQQLLVQLRPVLSTSRREDAVLKVNFGDFHWVKIPGGGAAAEVRPGDGTQGAATPVVYLALALRNVGNGIAVLQGWRFYPGQRRDRDHAPLAEFTRQTRDLYIPVDDVGFWQAALRDPDAAGYPEARAAIENHQVWTVELLYSDHDGGQRAISRFMAMPAQQHEQVPVADPNADQAAPAAPAAADPAQPPGPRWLATASRHWNVDQPGAR